MRNTPLATIPVPDSTDVADVPTHLYSAMTAMEKRLNLVFASAAARDAAFTAASVTPTDGLKCYLSDTDTQQTYLNGSWTSQEPLVICTSGTRPGSPTHTGMQIYETDTKSHRAWDGSNWILLDNPRLFAIQNALVGSPPSVTTGRYLMQAATVVGTIAIAGFAVTFPTPFPTGVLTILVTNGDNVGGQAAWCSTPTVNGFTVLFTSPSNGATARCNYIAIGW